MNMNGKNNKVIVKSNNLFIPELNFYTVVKFSMWSHLEKNPAFSILPWIKSELETTSTLNTSFKA